MPNRPMRPSAVLIDYYGTLTSDPDDEMRRIARDSHIHPQLLLDSIIPGKDGVGQAWMDLELGRVTALEFWSSVADDVAAVSGVRLDAGELATNFISTPIDDSAIECLSRLHALGMPIGVITNGFYLYGRHPQLDGLERMGLNVFASSRLGTRKPDAQIYLHALSVLHAEPSDTMYIEDNRIFLQGGRDVGLDSHLVVDSADTVSLLRRIEMAISGG